MPTFYMGAGSGAIEPTAAATASSTSTSSSDVVVRGNRVSVKVHISSQLVTLVHALVSKSLYPTAPSMLHCQTLATLNHSDVLNGSSTTTGSGGGSDGLEAAHPSDATSLDVPASVRAHAFVALGKLCLRDGALAKKVPAACGLPTCFIQANLVPSCNARTAPCCVARPGCYHACARAEGPELAGCGSK